MKILAYLCLLVLVGCDPGYHYRFTNAQRSSDGWYRIATGDLEVRTLGLGGLVHSSWLAPELEIKNKASDIFIIESVKLSTQGRSFTCYFSSDNDIKWRSVQAGETKRIPISVDFKESLYKVLGEQIVLEIEYRIGQASPLQAIELNFERE